MSFPLVYVVPPEPPCFLSWRFAAKSILSTRDATVSTPPTTAQVLDGMNYQKVKMLVPTMYARCEEVGERLSRFLVDDEDGRDLEVEEGT
jgi:hypothetical protein